jgi:hypothetical protein
MGTIMCMGVARANSILVVNFATEQMVSPDSMRSGIPENNQQHYARYLAASKKSTRFWRGYDVGRFALQFSHF